MPIVVELFTSQGCDACPLMDPVMAALADRDDVIALGFHVDYWDYLGWKDPFGRPTHSDRQRRYAEYFGTKLVYTPLLVIDGNDETRMAPMETIDRMIAQARAHGPKRMNVAIGARPDGKVAVTLDGDPQAEPALIWLAVYDQVRGTPVRGGDNLGRFLKNYNVVQRFEYLGVWSGGPVTLTLDGKALERERAGGMAVLVQRDGMGPFLGAAALEWD